MLSYHAISFLHLGHCEPGLIMEMLFGTLQITTFRKEPIINPNKADIDIHTVSHWVSVIEVVSIFSASPVF